MPKAWIENNIIRDIAHDEPYSLYHPDVAVHYDTMVPLEAKAGDTFKDGILTPYEHPVIITPVPVHQRIITDFEVRTLLTFKEKVDWDNDTSPDIKTAKLELLKLQTTRPEAQEIMDWLAQKGIFSKATTDKVLELY